MTYRKMRKRTKKQLALVLSVSLIMSSVSMSALASETEDQQTNNEPSVSVSVSVTETTDEKTGDTTTTTTTETSWSDTQEIGGGTGTDASGTDSEGTAGESGEGTDEGEDGGPGVTVESDVAVTGEKTVEGSETTTEITVTNRAGNVIEESGSISGQETTTTETITTETETTTGQLIEETTTPIESSTSENGTQETTTGEWTEGEAIFGEYEKGQWIDEVPAEGEIVDKGTTTDSAVVQTDVLEDKDNDNDESDIKVELNLTPVDQNKETGAAEDPDTNPDDEEKIYISWDDVQDTVPIAGTEDVLDENGRKIGTKETKVTPITKNGKVVGYEVETITTTAREGEPVEGETVETGITEPVTVTSTPDLPEGVAAGTEDILDEEGNKVGTVETTIEEIKDDAGNVIGYTITKVKTEEIHKEESAEAAGETIVTTKEPVETFVLPKQPEPAEIINAETGVKTVTTVENIVEDGRHVGYRTVTVELDADGKELSRSIEAVYGTTIVINESTAADLTTETTITDTTRVTASTTTIMGTTTTREVALKTEQTTNREIIEFVEDETWEMVTAPDGESYFLYKGEMYAVLDKSTLHDKFVDLAVDLTEYAPDGSNDIRGNPGDEGGYTGQILTGASADGEKNVYFGYGLYSNFLINDADGQGHEIRQYAIRDAAGKVSYVYCVELGAGLSSGSHYGEKMLQDGALYASDDVSRLTTVAHNGFWGTSEGIGSLDAVKDLLIRNGYTEEANTLTAGQALAATQAAIWEYGTDGKEKVNEKDLIYGEFIYTNGEPGFSSDVSDQEKTNIETLRALLVELAEENPLIRVGDKISADDIKGATIILEKKAENADGTAKTVNVGGQTHDVYNADLSFTLAVSTSAINGDLIVQVKDAANTIIATKRLAGEDSEGYGKIYPDANGTYTITGIELKEGVMITLNLTGTQQLADGVYIYNHTTHQDFIGLSTLENDVNLNVNMIFEVEEPEVEIRKSKTEKTTVTRGSRTDTRTGSRTDSHEDYTTEMDTATEETGQSVLKVYADVTVTEVTEETQITRREWNSSWNNKKDIDDNDDDDKGGGGSDGGDDPDDGGGGPGNGSGHRSGNDDHVADDAIIPEEAAALAGSLPKTGDRTGRWTLLSVFSALGLAIMSLTGKKREEDELK